MLFAQLRHIYPFESVAAASPIEHTVSVRDTRATPFDGYATGDGNNNYVQGEQFRTAVHEHIKRKEPKPRLPRIFHAVRMCATGQILLLLS